MMKTEYTEVGGFLQRDGVEHEEYAEACSTEVQEVEEKDGADLLEKVVDRDNLNRAYKRVKANKGASGVRWRALILKELTSLLSAKRV